MRILKRPFSTVSLLLRNPKLYFLLSLIGAAIVLHLLTRHDNVIIETRAASSRQRIMHQDLEGDGGPNIGTENNEVIKDESHRRHVLLGIRDSALLDKGPDGAQQMKGVQVNDSGTGDVLFEQRHGVDYDRLGNDVKVISDVKQRYWDDKKGEKKKDKNDTSAKFTPNEYPFNVNLTRILQYDMNGFASVKPINVFDHRYIINPDQTCSGSDVIRVLFIVKSAPRHTSKRTIIRDTWADRKRFPWMRTIFSFGIPNKDDNLSDLKEESARYHDIFLVNYSDNYYNLTLKTISGLTWAVTYCRRAVHVVSVDDDVYVAPDLLLSFLDKLPAWKAEILFSGHLLTGTKPIRDPLSKWYTPKTEYPFKNYPHYIFGGFVIMSMSTVRNFTIAAMYTKLFKFEDVYLGILAAKLGIKARDNIFVNSGRAFTISSSFKTTIASHYYGNPKDFRRAWDCHLSILDQQADKAVYCDYIGKRLEKLKSEIDSIADWMEFVKKSS